MKPVVFCGDCIEALALMPDGHVDAIVTDPPYGLEFMGKDWDAPWKESDVNADAGMSRTGYTDGGIRLERPSFTGSTNPKCGVCKGTRRGRRDGTAVVPVCRCADGGRFPNVRAIEMRAFQSWCETWLAECFRVLKPGGHLLAFGGTRTYHRMACAVEDAGFEIRDSIMWIYGSGFPKSLDVSKSIDKAAGAERTEVIGTRGLAKWKEGAPGGSAMKDDGGIRQNFEKVNTLLAPVTPDAVRWSGWGTALKPAHEPIVVARKPLIGTVAANVLAHGTGALNIDACRVGMSDADRQKIDNMGGFGTAGWTTENGSALEGRVDGSLASLGAKAHTAGRWPANVVFDEDAAAELDAQTQELTRRGNAVPSATGESSWFASKSEDKMASRGDSGGASRFFYCAKAGAKERPVGPDGTKHPTVKPLALMRWLVRLVTPVGGVVLDPFAGSGTTLEAAILEGFRYIGIEKDPAHCELIAVRLAPYFTEAA